MGNFTEEVRHKDGILENNNNINMTIRCRFVASQTLSRYVKSTKSTQNVS